MTGAKPAPFPLPKGLQLSSYSTEVLPDPSPYRRLVGKLLYLTLTRPDISYSVQLLSQFRQQPKQPHHRAALHVLRYLKGTTNKGLFYSTNNNL